MTTLRIRCIRVGLAINVAGLGLLFAPRPAQAGLISYALMVCEDLDVLKNPNNVTVAMNAAWKSQPTLLLERTIPYLELDNTSAQASITQLTMTIGDTSKNFDWASLIQTSPGVTFSLQSPDAIAGGIKSDTLVINFSGFAPGDFVRFRVDLSSDNPHGSLLMDYRTVLFHMNGNDSSKNSVVTVNFNDSTGNASLVKQFPNFSNNLPTAMSLAFPPGNGTDHVMPFVLADSGSGPVTTETALPEPDGLVLCGLGLLGLAGWGMRRRPRRAA